jgi:L-alanine-DL-glutamate epimerase-like enolase superfamily enzyme
MIITDSQLFSLNIPLKNQSSHHLAVRATGESLLVALADDAGNTGYGECTPRPYVTGETMRSTLEVLQAVLPQILKTRIDDVQELAWLLEGMEGLPQAPSARCALEMALLDLLGKNRRCRVLDLMGPPALETVFYSAVISGETPDQIESLAMQAAAGRIRQVKLKAGTDNNLNLQNTALLRRILGEHVEIRVDANAAWTEDSAPEHIQALADSGVLYFEQPLPKGEPEQWLRLRSRIPAEVRIYVDESVCSHAEARLLAERQAVDGFNLKISKHGGLLNALEVHSIARLYGLFCQLGCHVGETSLLSAAGRTLALLCGDLRACEGSFGLLLLKTDLTAKPLQAGYQGMGSLAELQDAFGWGVNVHLERVRPYLRILS